MSTFDFYTDAATDFTDVEIDYSDIDLTDIDTFTTAPDFPSPRTTIDDDDWLSAIPIHSPDSIDVDSPEPVSSHSTPTAADDTDTGSEYDPILNYEPPQPRRYSRMGPREEPEELPQPTIDYVDLREAIDLNETYRHHEDFACQSYDMHGGAPKTIDHRWRHFKHSSSDEIYRLIFYAKKFEGYESLTHWQRNFLEENRHLSPPICFFCDMPKHYWCDKVAVKIYKN